jgi:SAM-dependent methyltransferase
MAAFPWGSADALLKKELSMSPPSSHSRRNPGPPLSGSLPFLTPFALPVKPVLDALSFSPASGVLEIGPIACRFTLPIARTIATKKGTGTVYACDFKEEGVLRTYHKARDAHLSQLVVPLLWDTTTSNQVPLDDETVDVVISISTLELTAMKAAFVSECLRVLRPDGKLFIARWREARTLLTRNIPELSKEAAWDILNRSKNGICKTLDIPELEWAVLMVKSGVGVAS